MCLLCVFCVSGVYLWLQCVSFVLMCIFCCCVACCGHEVGHEVTFLYLMCLFAFVMNRGCFSVHIVLRVGGCVVSIFFVRASACFVCVAAACRRFGCVLTRCMFCCAKSRCQIGECVPHFFFLFYVSFLHKQWIFAVKSVTALLSFAGVSYTFACRRL